MSDQDFSLKTIIFPGPDPLGASAVPRVPQEFEKTEETKTKSIGAQAMALSTPLQRIVGFRDLTMSIKILLCRLLLKIFKTYLYYCELLYTGKLF